MDLLIYTPKKAADSKRLLGVTVDCPGFERKEIFHSLEGLSKGLCRPKTSETTVLLNITNKRQLSEAIAIQDFLRDVKLILVLPDRSHTTASKCHKLFPRYFSYADSDFSDISAVLTKMTSGPKKKAKPLGQPNE